MTPYSGSPATCGLGGTADPSGLGPPKGKRHSFHHKEPASSLELRAVGVLGFGELCPSDGDAWPPANSLREAVNSGAAAAAALQALCNAGLWSLLQINTICSVEHVSFLHDTHSLLPRWQRGERQRGLGKGGKMWPRPFLTQSHSFKPIAWVGEGH